MKNIITKTASIGILYSSLITVALARAEQTVPVSSAWSLIGIGALGLYLASRKSRK